MTEIKEVMDIRAAADYLGISTSALYKYVSEEKIPALKLGNHSRLKKAVLDHWMESQSEPSERRGSGRLRAIGR